MDFPISDVLALSAAGACCISAWFRGEKAERLGGVCLFVAWCLEALLHAAIPAGSTAYRYWITLSSEALLASAFLVLALCYCRVWLGLAMIFQGAILSLCAMQWTGSTGFKPMFFFAAQDLLNLLLLGNLIGGTMSSWRRRRDGSPVVPILAELSTA